MAAQTASSRLREIARTRPDRVALETASGRLTYGALEAGVAGMAARLVDDLGPGADRVALRLAGTEPFLVASLAIGRAGKVLVPIDPTAPIERARSILGEVGAGLVLSDVDGDGTALDQRVVDPASYHANPPDGAVDVEVSPDTLISVVFTSGSTGVPKGIMVTAEQRAAIGRWLEEHFDEGMRLGVLAAGSVASAESLLHAAVRIAATIVAYDIRGLGIAPLASWLREERVETFVTVPTVMRFFVPTLDADDHFRDLRIVAMSGEGLTWEEVLDLRRHLPREAVVHNVYSMTETSTIATMAVGPDTPPGSGPLPAGTPLPASWVRIVDEDGETVPDGEEGEILVEGHAVGLGYWGRPDLTAQVYSEMPGGGRRCRTGDRGRFRADGLLEHLGRLDHVVKISGNRVDLGEVESVLRSLDGVTAAAATAGPDPNGDLRVTAYAVPAAGDAVHAEGLRAGLARRLPGYMLPHAIVLLDALPMLPNGKVDRQRLPEMATARPALTAAMAPPARAIEAALAEVWADVLGFDEVGVDDDFFDLGGDSLRAARIFTEIHRRLGFDRPISLLLEAPTVALLASALAEGRGGDTLVPVQVAGTRPPLFVIHGGGGEVWFARALAGHLGPDQPVYALQPGVVPGDPIAEGSLEDLAARYVAEITRLRPHGSYLLYGYSLGGVIGFEVARQLQAAGGSIGLLALGDSVAPGRTSFPDAFPHRARGHLDRLRTLPAGRAALEAPRLVSRTVRFRARRALRRRHRPREFRRQGDRALRELGGLLVRYAPTAGLDSSVLLVRSGRAGGPPDRGWNTHVTGEVRVVPVDCRHSEMIDEPHVGEVARILRAAIDAALAPV